MSLDYTLKPPDKATITLHDLDQLLDDFVIRDHKEDSNGTLLSFSLVNKKETIEPLQFGLLQEGGYIINTYTYDEPAFRKFLESLVKIAKLLNMQITDLQTNETLKNPDDLVSHERIEYAAIQANTTANLDDILKNLK